jgi:hypothetical protein
MDDRAYTQLCQELEQAEIALEQATARRNAIKSQVSQNKDVLFDIQLTAKEGVEIADQFANGDLYFAGLWIGAEKIKDMGLNDDEGFFYLDFSNQKHYIPSDTLVTGTIKCPRNNAQLRRICSNLAEKVSG